MVEDQLPGHEGDVVSGGEVALGGEAGAVDEVGVSHAQLTGPEVHLGNKGGLAAGKILGHGHSGVIAGDHSDALEQLGDGHLLPLLQVDLGTAHAGGISGDGHHVVPGNAAAVQGFHDEKQGHDLGDAGGLQLLAGVFFVEDSAALLLHQHRRGGGCLRPGGGGGGGEVSSRYTGRQQQGGQRQRKETVHGGSLQIQMFL